MCVVREPGRSRNEPTDIQREPTRSHRPQSLRRPDPRCLFFHGKSRYLRKCRPIAAVSASCGCRPRRPLGSAHSPHTVRSQCLEEAGRGWASVVLRLRWERRPSFMLGWGIPSGGRFFVAAVQVYRPLAGSGWSCINAGRVGCSSHGFGLLGRRTRKEPKSTTFRQSGSQLRR
jgi:hypothetical protein